MQVFSRQSPSSTYTQYGQQGGYGYSQVRGHNVMVQHLTEAIFATCDLRPAEVVQRAFPCGCVLLPCVWTHRTHDHGSTILGIVRHCISGTERLVHRAWQGMTRGSYVTVRS